MLEDIEKLQEETSVREERYIEAIFLKKRSGPKIVGWKGGGYVWDLLTTVKCCRYFLLRSW